MVVRLVAHGDALFHELAATLAVDAEARAVGILLRVVPDDAAQVVERRVTQTAIVGEVPVLMARWAYGLP